MTREPAENPKQRKGVRGARAWPAARAAEALQALAHHVGLVGGRAPAPPRAVGSLDEAALEHRLRTTAAPLGVELEPVASRYGDLPALVASAGPALFQLPEGAGIVALVRGGGRSAVLLGPDRRPIRVVASGLVEALRAMPDPAIARDVERWLDAARLSARRRERTRNALFAESFRETPLATVWMLRKAPSRPFVEALGETGTFTRLAGLVAAHLVSVLIWVGAFWVLGKGALAGRGDSGWIVAWLLLLASEVPAHMLVVWFQADVSARAGAALKRRLLVGALRIEPDSLRSEGAGQMLSRALEAGTVEDLLVSGSIVALFSVSELAVSAWVLFSGAGGGWHVALLGAVTLALLFVARTAYRRQRSWTDARLSMTADLVEHMIGYRTRLVQQPVDAWHAGEDAALSHALGLARTMDRWVAMLRATPTAWLVLSVAALGPSFVSGSVSIESLAIAVGGLLLAAQALNKLVHATSDLGGAALAWRRVEPLFAAATQEPPPGVPEAAAASASSRDTPVVEARALSFRHRGRASPSLTAISLTLDRGDRLLLEGPSGSGKSTLAAILAGLRQPSDGLVLFDGLDWPTLGADGWRRRVALAPQFHENHLVAETLKFNLLMGKSWPPGASEEDEARELLDELGLGPLLERMPAGLLQQVGEGGWQLSHGERSRIYLARALLQGADVVVLDETFAALDPTTLKQAVACAERRAATLVVVSHP